MGYMRRSCLLALASYAFAQGSGGTNTSVFQYVNQLIGSNNGGNVFAGATLPYGQAKAVADVNGQNTGGFATDGSNITGFSHMHDSGTGGEPSMGQFPLFPQAFCAGDELDGCIYTVSERATPYVNNSVVATPGYFAVDLANGISTEMTVTEHAALYHFNFANATLNGNPLSPLMILDLTDLAASRQNATVIVDPDTGRITANGTFLPSFGVGSYVLNVCADFQGATIRDTGVYINNRSGTYPKTLFVNRGIDLFYIESGGIVRFNPPSDNNNTLSARVGVSFISMDQACTYAENEIPTWDFDSVKSAAEDAWANKLNVVSVDAAGANDSLLTTFYSGIYRSMISPQNYTGDNPLWESSEPYFDSWYCIWDLFRSQQPLLTIVDPYAQSEMVRSLIDIYKHLGWMPDCRMSLDKGFSQGGSNADVVLVDSYLKSIPNVDWDAAYAAVVKDAQAEPFFWAVEGRGGYMSYTTLGYIPEEDFDYLGFGVDYHSVSRTLEYAYNDYCAAQLAKGLGKQSDYEYYATRSGFWQNLFKANQTSFINGTDTGFVGFFQPKYLNQTFGFLDPTACSNLPDAQFCSLTSNPQAVFESSIWEYQFFVPHSVPTLIDLLGGPETFVKRLNYLFTSGIVSIGNEPTFLTLYLYHYAGRPGLSAQRAHFYIPSSFNDTLNGLTGNDDSGAFGSFIALTMAGLFPNAGQNIYLIIPPFFGSVSFKSPVTGKTATITNTNFDPSYSALFIQNATLNGKPYTKNWVPHEFFTEGWTLELTLGTTESSWGTAPEDLPPSFTPLNSGAPPPAPSSMPTGAASMDAMMGKVASL